MFWRSSSPTAVQDMPPRTPAAAAAARHRARAGVKSVRGQISDPIPLSGFDEVLVLTPLQTNFYVPVTKIESPPEERHARRSFGGIRFSFTSKDDLLSTAGAPPTPPSSASCGAPRDSDVWPMTASPTTPESTIPQNRPRDSVASDTSQKRKSAISCAFLRLFVREKSKSSEAPAKGQLEEWKQEAVTLMRTSPQHSDDDFFTMNRYDGPPESPSDADEDAASSYSVEDSVVERPSFASTAASLPISTRYSGPTGLKPRPATVQDYSSSVYAESIDTAGDTDMTQTPRRAMSLSDHFRNASDSSTAVSQPTLKLSMASITMDPVRDEVFDAIQPRGAERITCIPGVRVSATGDLSARISAIEDHLCRVETLLTQACDTAPSMRIQFGRGDCLVNVSLSLKSCYAVSPSREPDDSTPRSSAPCLRASASLPVLCEGTAGSPTIGGYGALTSLMESDRLSRYALELQVKKLRQQIELLVRDPLYAECKLGAKDDFHRNVPPKDVNMIGAIPTATYTPDLLI